MTLFAVGVAVFWDCVGVSGYKSSHVTFFYATPEEQTILTPLPRKVCWNKWGSTFAAREWCSFLLALASQRQPGKSGAELPRISGSSNWTTVQGCAPTLCSGLFLLGVRKLPRSYEVTCALTMGIEIFFCCCSSGMHQYIITTWEPESSLAVSGSLM